MTENVPGTDLPERSQQAATAAGETPRSLPAQAGTIPARRSLSAVRDRSGIWLGNAAAGLALLAAAAGVVSFSAQYQMVDAARGLPVVAALEAAIPDTAALIFASLGIALALQGRRAVRARLLNLASVATSVFMNVLAASGGWRGLAIWAMPPVAYALARTRSIGVVRSTTIARHQALRQAAGDETTPLAVIGGLVLWLPRLVLAPVSTLRGFRRGCSASSRPRPPAPIAGRPGRRPEPAGCSVPPPRSALRTGTGPATKTAPFLALAAKSHGPLVAITSQQSRGSAPTWPR